VEKIKAFLNFENKIKNNKLSEMPESPGILECKNVSFGYDKDNFVLKNINLKIDAKEKIALVGYNGAGKTTLIKLLLRLYEPTEGIILLNGIDIKEYDINEYRNYIGVIFQDFQLFAAEIGENVVMNKVKDSDGDNIINAIQISGFYDRYKSLKNGLKTVLTNEFDNEGTDLSGGESQKLAVARAFYKNAGLVLLDEPSSALDPIAEYNLNMSMNHVAKEKTVIFISHRLSTTRRADRIYLLENGCIAEQGTHDELLSLNGQYNQMWNVQALKYRSN
jgi:ATP-binding cassette subfamily B protein